MKRTVCGLLALVALSVATNLRADIFTPGGDCGFGMPGQGGTRQMQAVCQGDEVQLTYTTVYHVCEFVTKTVTVEVEGAKVEKQVAQCVTKPVVEMKTRSAMLDQLKAFGLDRKKIGPKQLKKRLAESTAVLVCEYDQKVDAAYLKLVKADTIVLMLPPQPSYAMPAPMAAPDSPPPPPPGSAAAPVPAPAAPAPVAPAPAPAPAPAAPVPVAAPATPAAPPPGEPLAVPDRGPPGESHAEPIAALAKVSDALLHLRRTITTTRETTITIQKEVDGRTELMTSALNHTTKTEQSVAYSPIAAKAVTKSGEELTAEELEERLAKEAPVLVSSDGRDINPQFLEIIRDDAILIQVPVSMPAPPVMMPAPPPADGEAPPST